MHLAEEVDVGYVCENYDFLDSWLAVCYPPNHREFIKSSRVFLLENVGDRQRVNAVIQKLAELYPDKGRLNKIIKKFAEIADRVPTGDNVFDEQYKNLIENIFVPEKF